MYYSKEQKEKDKTPAQLHTDFAPVFQSSSILPSILSAPPKMMMSNPLSNCFLSARALLETCAQFSLNFSASVSFSLVVISLRKLRACLCCSQLPLVSLRKWNLMRHVLLLDSTICSAYISSVFDRQSP